jgi:small subunit ribosomal protein S6
VIQLGDYEAVVIMKPHLVDDEITKIVSSIEDNIIQRNGELISKPFVEKRKLAYQIAKFSDGYFAFFYYVGNIDITKRIDEICRFNENVLRLINFRLETRDSILQNVSKSLIEEEKVESKVDDVEEDEEEEEEE